MKVDRQLLPRTFGPWFGRFQRLTEVQERSIPLVMEGKDVLICSPTASGKTEAYAAPCAEMAARHAQDSPVAVIVAPTRALTNDLKRRLEGPMSDADVSFGRYTGEHKERVAGKLPKIMVATPEALDSLIARHPSTLALTRIVVLDEIHVLDNTPRGDQLRVLLHRLEAIAAHRPQRIAASATVDRPAELGARYLQDFELVVVNGIRKIAAKAFDGSTPAEMTRHLNELGTHGFKKILVFCRSRNQVETYATKLLGATKFSNAVYAHHGSLAKATRERNERLFQQAPAAVCFATMTLEMGIDIGTVDYVLLAGLPADVASLLQRIGRGSRRGDSTRAGFVVKHAAERHVFQTMFRLAMADRLCGSAYGFRPSVIVQQALVMACSGTYIEEKSLRAAIPPEVRRELGKTACADILEQLVQEELLERHGSGRFVATETVEERYDLGTLHSNIDDVGGIDIIDRLTGDVLGSIQGTDSGNIEIGGRDRKIAKETQGRLLTDAGRGSTPARFRSSKSPSVSLALARAVVEALGVDEDALGVVQDGHSTIVLHGLGTVGSLYLGYLLGRSSRSIAAASPYKIVSGAQIADMPPTDSDDVDRFVEGQLSALSQLTAPGPWNRVVPEDLRIAATRKITGIDAVASFLDRTHVQEIPQPSEELVTILRDL